MAEAAEPKTHRHHHKHKHHHKHRATEESIVAADNVIVTKPDTITEPDMTTETALSSETGKKTDDKEMLTEQKENIVPDAAPECIPAAEPVSRKKHKHEKSSKHRKCRNKKRKAITSSSDEESSSEDAKSSDDEKAKEQIAKEAARLQRAVNCAGAGKHHQLADVARVVKGEMKFPPRAAKCVAHKKIEARKESGTDRLLSMTEEEAVQELLKEYAGAVEESLQLLQSDFALHGTPELARVHYSELAAWIVCRKDIAFAAMSDDPNNEVDPEVAADVVLRNPKKITREFNTPRLALLNCLSKVLITLKSLSGPAIMTLYQMAVCLDKACGPPSEGVSRSVSNGKMTCQFTGEKIPTNEQPCVLKFTYVNDIHAKVVRTFYVSQKSKGKVLDLYAYWYWPKELHEALVRKYEAIKGDDMPKEEALEKIMIEARSPALWQRFENGRMVAVALLAEKTTVLSELLAPEESKDIDDEKDDEASEAEVGPPPAKKSREADCDSQKAK